jgi:hypothetical protein
MSNFDLLNAIGDVRALGPDAGIIAPGRHLAEARSSGRIVPRRGSAGGAIQRGGE